MLSAKLVTAHFQRSQHRVQYSGQATRLGRPSGPIDYHVKKAGMATGLTTGFIGNNWVDILNLEILGVRSLALVVKSDNNMPFGKQIVLNVAFW